MSLPSELDFGGDWTEWRRYKVREKPSQDLEDPESFGFYGIYLLALPEALTDQDNGLSEHIIYIGMSRDVDRRLEKSHSAVRCYKKRFEDPFCDRLYYSAWYSGVFHGFATDAVAHAKALLHERWLLYKFAHQHGRFPQLNNT